MGFRVLFADNDPSIGSALERLFGSDEAIDAVTARSADAALQVLESSTIDLVVADTMKTSENGSELLVEVRRQHPELPLILLTEHSPKQYASLLEQVGAELPVVTKPWSVDELRTAILDQLDHDVAMTEEDVFVKTYGIAPERIERARRVRDRMAKPVPLGEVLMQMGDLTSEQLDQVQRDKLSRLSLIELLAEQGVLAPDLVKSCEEVKERKPNVDDFTLLVGNEFVTEEQYLRALAIKHDLQYVEPDTKSVDGFVLGKASFRYLLKHAVLPIGLKDGRLRATVATPFDRPLILELERMFNHPIEVQVCTRDAITEALRTLQRLEGGSGEKGKGLEYRVIEDQKKGIDVGDEAVQIVDHLILRALQAGASDLHMEPMQHSMRVRVRVDGVLQNLTEVAKEEIPRVVSRIKILASADIAERRLHQDGKIFVQANGGEIDIRMSSYASVHGETIVLRLLDRNRGLVPMERLGFVPNIKEIIEDIILPASTGLVLVTGPTGSGKTTTLYSFLQHHIDPSEKVITAEDPVEYVTDGIVQCPVNEKTGPTFADSLRSMLRQDPDTIVVGEVRDQTTARLAFEAALTGHKVYSTFHTDDSIIVPVRLLEMGVESFLIASALSAVLAQRLLRALCKDCRAPTKPTTKQLRFLQIDPAWVRGEKFYAPKGCAHCDDTGYKSRVGIHEVLMPDDDFKEAVLARSSAKVLRALARQQPQFLSLTEDGLLKAASGKTSLDELVVSLPRGVPPRPLSELRNIAGTRRPS